MIENYGNYGTKFCWYFARWPCSGWVGRWKGLIVRWTKIEIVTALCINIHDYSYRINKQNITFCLPFMFLHIHWKNNSLKSRCHINVLWHSQPLPIYQLYLLWYNLQYMYNIALELLSSIIYNWLREQHIIVIIILHSVFLRMFWVSHLSGKGF